MKKKKSKRTEEWRKVLVFARRDPEGPYDPENCFFRPARTEKEAQMGMEEWLPGEPDVLPMSEDHREQFRELKTAFERRRFKVWHRMLWRAEISRGMN